MDILKDLFGVDSDSNPSALWLEEDGKPLEDNPFSVVNGVLYDKYDHVRDDVLGKAARGKITLISEGQPVLSKGDVYFFVNEKNTVKRKVCKNDLLDLFNILAGNVFDEKPNKEDAARIESIVVGLRKMNMCLFPYGIHGDAVDLRNRILSLMDGQDKGEEMAGVLRESFKTMNV